MTDPRQIEMTDYIEEAIRLRIIERLEAAPRQHKPAWRAALQKHTTRMLESETRATEQTP